MSPLLLLLQFSPLVTALTAGLGHVRLVTSPQCTRRLVLTHACISKAEEFFESGKLYDDGTVNRTAPFWWRPPPRGIPDQMLADRRGPYFATLGEPDEQTGERPDFLRRDDWHPSSRYTTEERTALAFADAQAAAEGATDEWDNVDAIVPLEEEEFHENFDPIDCVEKIACCSMPTSWQEYQGLVQQVKEVQADPAATATQHEEAARLLLGLDRFYPTFKNILAEGCVGFTIRVQFFPTAPPRSPVHA